MSEAEKLLNEALSAFDFGGTLVGAVRYGSGHINDTFVVHTQPGEEPCRRFILQRISSAAFKHPEQVMANIAGVTSFLGKKIAEAGGEHAAALRAYLTTRASWERVTMEYYVSPSTLERIRRRFFELW